MVIIDEAWDLMGTGNSGTFIEAGYRRARKHGGAFFTATQSVADYFKSATAQAVPENADWMFLLRQKAESIEAMAQSDKLVMDKTTKNLLRSVTTSVGHYSEVFVRAGDLPPSVGRLSADPFSLLTASLLCRRLRRGPALRQPRDGCCRCRRSGSGRSRFQEPPSYPRIAGAHHA